LRIQQDCRLQASQTKLAEPFDNNNYPAHRQPLFAASKKVLKKVLKKMPRAHVVHTFQSSTVSRFSFVDFGVLCGECFGIEYGEWSGMEPQPFPSCEHRTRRLCYTDTFPTNHIRKAWLQDSSALQGLKQPAIVHTTPLLKL
jgi:hypothetical protein